MNQHHVSSLEVTLLDVMYAYVDEACPALQSLSAAEPGDYRLCMSGDFLQPFASTSAAKDGEDDDWEDDDDEYDDEDDYEDEEDEDDWEDDDDDEYEDDWEDDDDDEYDDEDDYDEDD